MLPEGVQRAMVKSSGIITKDKKQFTLNLSCPKGIKGAIGKPP